jgi:hypothetical protein
MKNNNLSAEIHENFTNYLNEFAPSPEFDDSLVNNHILDEYQMCKHDLSKYIPYIAISTNCGLSMKKYYYTLKLPTFFINKNPFTTNKINQDENFDTDSERENERKIFYDMMYKMKDNLTDEQLTKLMTPEMIIELNRTMGDKNSL